MLAGDCCDSRNVLFYLGIMLERGCNICSEYVCTTTKLFVMKNLQSSSSLASHWRELLLELPDSSIKMLRQCRLRNEYPLRTTLFASSDTLLRMAIRSTVRLTVVSSVSSAVSSQQWRLTDICSAIVLLCFFFNWISGQQYAWSLSVLHIFSELTRFHIMNVYTLTLVRTWSYITISDATTWI